MKVKTAVKRVEEAVNYDEFERANQLLKKYRRRFGNRHFTYWLRLHIANGLYFEEAQQEFKRAIEAKLKEKNT